jgi:small-conductance mechanosensitive channel
MSRPRWLVALVAALIAALCLAASLAQASSPPDRGTPRRAWEGFLARAGAGDYAEAAQFLDLRALSAGTRTKGPDLARKLHSVLAQELVVNPATLSDDPDGDPGDGPQTDLVGTIELDGEPSAIALARTREGGNVAWLFSKTTVAAVPALYAVHGTNWLGDSLPSFLSRGSILGMAAWQWVGLALSVVAALGLGLAASVLVLGLLRFTLRKRKEGVVTLLQAETRGPLRFGLGSLVFAALVHTLELPASSMLVVGPVIDGLLVVASAWLLSRLVHVGASALEGAAAEDTADDLRTRGVRTQVALLRRIATVLLWLVAIAAVLMQFDVVRSVGTSLLASAGLAGIVLGLAAQRSLGGIFAGIHMAIAQPIRIGDAVVIEGHFGIIEQIKLTHVLVKLWDDRRLVVPTSRFLEQSFENWTRVGPELKGEIVLHVDFSTPVEAVRAELERQCEASPLWDRRLARLIVLDANERSMTLRATVSAANHEKLWDLRAELREGLLRYLREKDGGAHLPKVRQSDVASSPPR